MSLLGVDNETPDRAVIVPEGSDQNTNLYAAAIAWIEIADTLITERKTVSEAVEDANFILGTIHRVPESVLRFRVVGNGNIKIR